MQSEKNPVKIMIKIGSKHLDPFLYLQQQQQKALENLLLKLAYLLAAAANDLL